MIAWNVNVSESCGIRLTMDVFAPESAAPRGALLFLHGGGFTGGCKEQFLAIGTAVALKTGWVCAALDYRLATQAPFPAQLADVRAALRHLTRPDSGYGVDPSRIVLAGGSPGGCIAAQSILLGGGGRGILLNGIVNLPAFAARNPEETDNLLSYMPDRAMWERYSPHRLAAEGNRADFLLIHGEADEVVSPHDIKAFAETIRQSGGTARTVFLPGEGHAWFNTPQKQPQVIDIISDFITQAAR